jgi:tripartite-type tricarboxylate transporter receptor subunit TctC
MSHPKLHSLLACILALGTAIFTPQALAQTWAKGTIRIVVPFQAGGSTDFLARALGQKLSERLHQPVIVENKAGANGTVGGAYVAKAAPDGLTLLIAQSGFASNPSLFKNLSYDQTTDLVPVSLMASGPLVLTVNAAFPAKSVKDLIALAKEKPGEINFGSAGIGSLPHLAPELFDIMAGTKMTHIPYKGSGAALADVISGQVPVYYMNLMLSLPYLKSGKLRALAVTSPQRSSIAPELPTLAESGLPGYDMSTWYGLFAPGKMSKPLVLTIQQEFAQILRQPDVTAKFAADGVEVVASTPEAFQEFLGREVQKFSKIIRTAGIRAGE